MLKTVASYVVLVGVPLLGLFGILHLGKSLEPPPHVGGAWTIEAACPSVAEHTSLSIEQSGKFLRVRAAGGAPSRGSLDGDHLTATVLVDACELAIDARLVDHGERLVGTIAAPQCSVCPASDFDAARAKAGE